MHLKDCLFGLDIYLFVRLYDRMFLRMLFLKTNFRPRYCLLLLPFSDNESIHGALSLFLNLRETHVYNSVVNIESSQLHVDDTGE
jgi:hypothetical protein